MSDARLPRVLAVAVLAAVTPVSSRAQAWLLPKGEASFGLGFQHTRALHHFGEQGERFGGNRIYGNTLQAYLSYSVTDRLTLSVGLPFVSSRYDGPFPHRHPIFNVDGTLTIHEDGFPKFAPPTLDDGHWHGTFQDFRFDGRFMAFTEPLVVTPFVTAVLPSHAYEPFSHSAPGRKLWELHLGASLGRRLDPFLPDAYVEASYHYAFVEKVLGLKHDMSLIDAQIGYFVTPALSLRLLGAWQNTHSNYTDAQFYGGPPPAANSVVSGNRFILAFLRHDQGEPVDSFNAGLGAGYTLTGNLDVFAAAYKTFSGRNGIGTDIGLLAGMNVSFSPARIVKKSKRDSRRPVPLPP